MRTEEERNVTGVTVLHGAPCTWPRVHPRCSRTSASARGAASGAKPRATYSELRAPRDIQSRSAFPFTRTWPHMHDAYGGFPEIPAPRGRFPQGTGRIEPVSWRGGALRSPQIRVMASWERSERLSRRELRWAPRGAEGGRIELHYGWAPADAPLGGTRRFGRPSSTDRSTDRAGHPEHGTEHRRRMGRVKRRSIEGSRHV